MKLFFSLVFLLLQAPVMAAPLSAQQGDAILKELRAIRSLLEVQQGRADEFRKAFDPRAARPAVAVDGRPPEVATSNKVSIKNLPIQGRQDAPLVMVMFTDYECPFCKRFEAETFPLIKSNFIAPGKLKFVVLDAPLDSHPNARKAAEATRCAADQGHFWEYREKLAFTNEQLDTAKMARLAAEAGMNAEVFGQCLSSGKYTKAVADAVAAASAVGVNGTPTFVLGKERDGVVEGVQIIGAQPYATFEQKIVESGR